MKIQICSDLHLEFQKNSEWLKRNPLIPKGDILVIAGDTYHLDKAYKNLAFIEQVSNDFEQVFLIPGNHEYYGGFDVSTALDPTFREIKSNVFIVNNKTIEFNDTTFIFSTMWSHIERNPFAVLRGMMDFRQIKFKDSPFTVEHFNGIHKAAFYFLEEAVKKEGKKVVITHHLPSILCNVPEYKGSILNEAFYVEKTNFILDHEIDTWIYGHSHRNLADFNIGGTKMVTNQFGYVGLNEHLDFDYGKVIEV